MVAVPAHRTGSATLRSWYLPNQNATPPARAVARNSTASEGRDRSRERCSRYSARSFLFAHTVACACGSPSLPTFSRIPSSQAGTAIGVPGHATAVRSRPAAVIPQRLTFRHRAAHTPGGARGCRAENEHRWAEDLDAAHVQRYDAEMDPVHRSRSNCSAVSGSTPPRPLSTSARGPASSPVSSHGSALESSQSRV